MTEFEMQVCLQQLGQLNRSHGRRLARLVTAVTQRASLELPRPLDEHRLPRWPRIPDNAAELAEEILEEMQAGKSDRPWAEGYALGIVKSQYRRVIKPDGEEGYQTDGDVLRSAGRRSGKSPTAAPRKRAASVASTSRTRGRSKQSQSEEPQPKARSISAGSVPSTRDGKHSCGHWAATGSRASVAIFGSQLLDSFT